MPTSSYQSLFLTIDRIYAAILHDNYFLRVYPVLFAIGSIVSILIQTKLKHNDNEHGSNGKPYLLDPANLLNIVFANGALVWFTMYFGALVLMRFFIVEQHAPNNNDSTIADLDTFSKMKKSPVLKKIAMCLLFNVTWVILLGWFFGESIIKRIENLVGIDISGHYIVLTSASISLLFELKEIIEDIRKIAACETLANSSSFGDALHQAVLLLDYDAQWVIPLCYYLQIAILITLTIWVLLFSITSVYFHTIMEKILGLVVGYLMVYAAYCRQLYDL